MDIDRVARPEICHGGGPSESIPSLGGVFRDAESLDAELDAYDAYPGKAIAWCLLCNRPIVGEADLISKKYVIHNCRKGRALAALTGTEPMRGSLESTGAVAH
jgi:hypothetical protein